MPSIDEELLSLALTVMNFNCKTVSICDMIKRNESDVRDSVFEVLAKTVFKFFCFILFLERGLHENEAF